MQPHTGLKILAHLKLNCSQLPINVVISWFRHDSSSVRQKKPSGQDASPSAGLHVCGVASWSCRRKLWRSRLEADADVPICKASRRKKRAETESVLCIMIEGEALSASSRRCGEEQRSERCCRISSTRLCFVNDAAREQEGWWE